ncbi:MAG: hypothetical protein GXP15_03960 [Gammaproteobacteria bacterium]|nr:hypothetical protein [Gammaproteobacteria bacterium]
MNARIRQLLADISKLEDELTTVIQEQQIKLRYRIEGSRIRFDANLRKIHHELKTGLLTWLRASEIRNVISAPFIYMMIIPFVFLDLVLSIYQLICFPLYRIPKVKRSSYILIDRHQLAYLNIIEKFNCIYCGYVGGLVAYTRQIVTRTEMYWCPIKHARAILDPHRQYAAFADYGDADNYPSLLAKMRLDLARQEQSGDVDSERPHDR